MASLTGILSGNADKVAKRQIEGITAGVKYAGEHLNSGLNQYKDYANQALAQYDPYAATAEKGYSTYADALGLNGAQGTANAQSTYSSSPGYQFQMDQGLQALERSAASRGMLASGNTSTDILGYSQGLASQDYNSWLDRLQGIGSQGIGMAGAKAGINTGTGGKSYETSDSLADLAWNAATGVGNANAQAEAAKGQGILGGISLGTKLLGSAFGAGGF